MGETRIEWASDVWNPVRGCARVSEGCRNCYAERMAHRFSGPGQPYEGLTRTTSRGPQWIGRARFVPEMLGAPLRWRKPRRVFVNSMSDLFHEDVTNEQIAAVFGVMADCQRHTFQVLTKRPERMVAWFQQMQDSAERTMRSACHTGADSIYWHRDRIMRTAAERFGVTKYIGHTQEWPLPNVHIGVSVEDQRTADERIPLLLQTPAAVRWVSYEPALGAVDLSAYMPAAKQWYPDPETNAEILADIAAGEAIDRAAGIRKDWHRGTGRLDWLVAGGESGPGARPCNVEWIRDIVGQCKAASVPVFVKQLGSAPSQDLNDNDGHRHLGEWLVPYGEFRNRKGADPAEWPADLRVREFPEAQR